jgi:hypothetical protein
MSSEEHVPPFEQSAGAELETIVDWGNCTIGRLEDAEFNQVIDKFELAGIKLVTNRVITLRLWLQLWETQTGQILWESAGEGNQSPK